MAVAMKFNFKQVASDEPCWVIEVSGRHRINRRRSIGASCSISVEENQEAPDDPTRASEEHRTNRRIVYQRACLGNQGALLRTGLSDAQSDKGVGVIVACLQAQKKKSPKDRMIRRPSE